MWYYLSAGFLFFRLSDSGRCLSVDRHWPQPGCHQADEIASWRPSAIPGIQRALLKAQMRAGTLALPRIVGLAMQ
jgi:hypothetical protein